MANMISILGSTGSIGRQTLDVVEQLGLKVAAITAHSSVDRVEEQARRFSPRLAVMTDEAAARDLAVRLADTPVRCWRRFCLGGSGYRAGGGYRGHRRGGMVACGRRLRPSERASALPWPIRRRWSAPESWSWTRRSAAAPRLCRWTPSTRPSSSVCRAARTAGRSGG